VFDNENSFYKLRGEVRKYYSFRELSIATIAFRFAGEKIIGDHPFFESAFLGGNESLRGFERQRFAGDASLLAGRKFVCVLQRFRSLFTLGSISGFAETGRIFLSSEQSSRWHNIIGGEYGSRSSSRSILQTSRLPDQKKNMLFMRPWDLCSRFKRFSI